MGLLACAIGLAQTNRTPVQLDATNGSTNLAKLVKLSDLVVVGEFRVGTNERMAKTPIKIVETIRESVFPATNVAPCFRPTVMTISPKKGSRWIFFLQQPWEITNGIEYRKVVGTYGKEKHIWNDDFEGILPATEENLKALRAFFASSTNGNEASTVRVFIAEYLLRIYLKPDKDLIVFVSLSDAERQQLAAEFKRLKIQPVSSAERVNGSELRDKATKAKGMELRVEDLVFTNNVAVAGAWWGPDVRFDIRLVKDSEWVIREVHQSVFDRIRR
jgi:hypothetical protein